MINLFKKKVIDINLAQQFFYDIEGNKTEKSEILARSSNGLNIQNLVNSLEKHSRGHELDIEVLSQVIDQKIYKTSHLFINLTNTSLHKKNLDSILFLLSCIPGEKTVEISESLLSWRHKEGIMAIYLLRSIGVDIALDDFILNYKFSLQELGKIQPEYIKISSDSFKSLSIKTLSKNIILAKKISPNSKIVIEGVASSELVEKASHVNGDYYQGYHFNRPKLIT